MSRPGKSYRPDIDGLRAVAVTAVLAFHAFPSALSGGFVGVDVFFVISGYLITSILLDEIHGGQFSILHFYVRRARRLFPALLVVMLATMLACWAFMVGFEWRNIGKHLVAGAMYLSNVLLWREVGYFDPQAEAKPLLHLWSLGVEEQFYVVWPLLLWAMAHIFRIKPLLLTALLALISFIACVTLTRNSLPAAFYLPFTRFWELAAGGLLAMTMIRDASTTSRGLPPITAQLAAVSGVALIAASLLWQYPPGSFPGAIATLPVVGTILLIAAGPMSWVNRQVLASRPFVYIGRISYPLYLWHWPLLSLAFLLTDGTERTGLRVGLLLAAVILADLTERLVERPFRARLPAQQALIQARNLWIATAVIGVAGLAIWQGAIPSRAQASPVAASVERAKLDWSAPDTALLSRSSSKYVLLVGDSHMQQYWPRAQSVVASEPDKDLPSIELFTNSGCAPLPGLDRIGNPCHKFVEAAFERARAPEVTRIILAASWAGLESRNDLYLAGDANRKPIRFLSEAGRVSLKKFTQDLAALRAAGKDVVLVLSTPRGKLVDPARLYDRWAAQATGISNSVSRAALYREVATIDAVFRETALAAGVRIIEPFEWMCSATTCELTEATGDPVFIDESHLRATFVRERAKFLDQLLR
jgi:peptidoglycan/LPS O-acetylase OafA/YrhL